MAHSWHRAVTSAIVAASLAPAQTGATFLRTPGPFDDVKGQANIHLVCQPSTDPYSRILITGIFDHDSSDRVESLDVFYQEVERGREPYETDRSKEYVDSTLWQNHDQLDYIWRGTWKRNRKISMMGHLWWEGRWMYSEIRFRYAAPYDASRPMNAYCNAINEEEKEGKFIPKQKLPDDEPFALFKKLLLVSKHDSIEKPEPEASETPASPAPRRYSPGNRQGEVSSAPGTVSAPVIMQRPFNAPHYAAPPVPRYVWQWNGPNGMGMWVERR